jgi:hypothetical protein
MFRRLQRTLLRWHKMGKIVDIDRDCHCLQAVDPSWLLGNYKGDQQIECGRAPLTPGEKSTRRCVW